MSDMIIGRTIKSVRLQTKAEVERQGWYRPATVLVLDDGTQLYASSDEEGNDSGAMFGTAKDGGDFYVFPEKP